MAMAIHPTPICSLKSSCKLGVLFGYSDSWKVLRANNEAFPCSNAAKFQSLQVKAIDKGNSSTDDQSAEPTTSLVCSDCEGNGAIQCSQCKGSGVNSEDHFNGRFKAGDMCWLCGGKKEMLCGSCNGAGFLGGFMSRLND